MGMTTDHYPKAGGCRAQIDLLHVMDQVNLDGPQLHHFPVGEFLRPRPFVIISANCDDGREALQCFEHL